jgi:hypothetical protein
MKSITHHINTVRSQPHHIRKRVAFGSAFVLTALIGLIWVGTSLSSGAFAVHGSSFAQATGSEKSAIAATGSSNAGLAASAAALGASAAAPVGIQIVDAPKPSVATTTEATIIPF